MEQTDIIVKCCKCHRVRLANRWQHEEKPQAAKKRYSHSYCPSCLIKAHADLDACQVLVG